MKDYYNTNDESGGQLGQSRRRATDQQQIVLRFFERNPGRNFAPHQIQQAVLPGSPLTSIRRAVTNLTDAGKLQKTDTKVAGSYGKQVHTWKLSEPEGLW